MKLILYTDIHSHIIPGIDDGASDDSSASDMVRIAAANGTAHIVATPHFISGALENDSNLIHEKCRQLQNLMNGEGLGITVYPGAEVLISHDLPELYDAGVICTLNNSCYILIELPMSGLPVYTDDILFKLQLKGLIPIIAHPERNSEIFGNPDVLVRLAHRGILAQVNSGSITGLYGRKVKNAAIKFIRMGLIQFVASDAHTSRRRSPNLIKAEKIVKKKFGQEMVERLFYINGKTVLENGTISVNLVENRNGFMHLKGE